MKKIIIAMVTILFIGGVTACSEDFTTNPREDGEDLETFFLEEENVDAAIIGIYDLMQHTYSVDWHSAFLVKQLPGDDMNAAGGNSGDQPQLQDIDDYANVSTSNQSIESVWNLFYRTISLSNLVIENIKESDLSNKELALAEAKFLRAWSYFELTTMFGDVPLRLTIPSTADEFGIAKSPRADIYTQVKADLTDAIAGLPDKTALTEDFRVSKGAAQALMGKVLVFEGLYGEAIPFFEAVISNPAHDLEDNPEDAWSINHEFGKESLFEIGFISTTGRDWGNFAWGGRNENNIHIQLMGPRGDGIFDVSPVGLINGWGFNLPTAKLLNAFDAAGDTDRKLATVMTEDELIAAGGSVDESAATGGSIWDYEGGIRIKYATKEEDTSADGVKELNYGTNYRLYRYAEMLLLAAEAYNKDNKDAEARTELNKVRNRAGLPDVDASLAGDDLFEAIVNEKFLELAHEGQRFWDLVRWGKAATELAGTGYTSKNDLFPIPETEIEKNSELTQADQNPGY
ncbi:RagB/SusD family nutrient uptake outer membrane protein [Cellulophaga lytica]|uniref:RagB/SusD family nutrient uptake outer membrane protein n=1 Tax=Cellulophaga lytica TaxID=979 RepID=UPI0004F8E3FE|nr:RagB/SusD family nutrient uptake outer membrane protein [Cellulophaga lytica]AIM61164.1 membrane protein [Cellulophaga lytica]MDO6854065.1 RagB/SusD family nutrient uptake outer membrane protein [Cellulophaga lytica]SNQ43335.1 RagB/SusD domain-containing protein [Cellulophaga lytica]